MKAVVLPRAQGKTQRMLDWMIRGKDRVLIVMSVRERNRLRELFKELPEEAGRIVAFDEVLRGSLRGRFAAPIFGIDEVEFVLEQLVRGPVEVISFSGEVES